MKRIQFVLPILLSAVLFSGCLNFLVRYTIHKDGSLRLLSRVEIDTSILNGMNSFASKMDSPKSGHGKKKAKKENIEQSLIDSIRLQASGKQMKQLLGLSYVKHAEVTAVPTDSSLIVNAIVDLNSYRDLNALSNRFIDLDTTTTQAQKAALKQLSIIREHGDTVEFNARWDDALTGTDALNAMNAAGQDSTQTVSTDPNDSTAVQMAELGKALATMFSMRIEVEAPNLLGYDANADFDPKTNIVSWSSQKMSELKNPPKRVSGQLWFRKP